MASLALGLMSGTSCDGVTAALAMFSPGRVVVRAHGTVSYPAPLTRLLLQAGHLRAPELSALHMALGECFASAALVLLRRARVHPRRITVIGSHGHTVYHGPNDPIPSTLQLGAAAVIAERTGLPVIDDFRARDIAAGGQGAPLVPVFDAAFFGRGPTRALLNLGGIANVAIVGRRVRPMAFDTGPGNTLLDLMARRLTKARHGYDRGGALARTGRIREDLLRALRRDPYFRRRPPKSTGREQFNEAWLRRAVGPALRTRPRDVLATLTYFTAWSVAAALRTFGPATLREVIVSGGGVRNRTLMAHLRACLAPTPVRLSDAYGIPAHAKEAVAFAYLALQAWRGRPNHLPQTTGARHEVPLGRLTPARAALDNR